MPRGLHHADAWVSNVEYLGTPFSNEQIPLRGAED